MALMRIYLGFALFLCKLTKTPVSFLLHPLDLVGGDQVKQLSFFPGMNVTSIKKVAVFKKVIQTLLQNYNVVNMSTYGNYLIKNSKMRKIGLN